MSYFFYIPTYGGGGGGASALADLSDVALSGPVSGQALVYGPGGKWLNTEVVAEESQTIAELFTAQTSVSAYKAVAINPANGQIYYPDPLVFSDVIRLAGLSDSTIIAGSSGSIIRTGNISNALGWNWNLNSAIYLAAAGELTQTAPTSGYLIVMGFPTSTTSMFVDIQSPIYLG